VRKIPAIDGNLDHNRRKIPGIDVNYDSMTACHTRLSVLGASLGLLLALGGVHGAHALRPSRLAARASATRMSAPSSSLPHVIICPGFGNDMVDYVSPLGLPQDQGLCAALTRRGYACSVVQVNRGDWLRVATGLRDWAFLRGRGTPEGPAFRWYIDRLRATVDAEVSRSGERVVLLGHSAGGWLARAALADNEWIGDGRTSDSLISGLVTLGSPHLPPPADMRDQTFGVLRHVDNAYPGAYLDGIAYATVASDSIVGYGDAERGSAARYAFGSYEMVCGQGDVPGDGVVPTCSAHLDGARLQLTLNKAVHSINEPGTTQPTARWYGSEGVIDEWLVPVESVLGLVRSSVGAGVSPLVGGVAAPLWSPTDSSLGDVASPLQ
jgi:pimeloyl-ACP methyl ester carboxylesterase